MPSVVEDDDNFFKKRKTADYMSGQDKKKIEIKLAKLAMRIISHGLTIPVLLRRVLVEIAPQHIWLG